MADTSIQPGFYDRSLELNNSGDQTAAEIPYFVFNADDEDAAVKYAYSNVSYYYNDMALQTIRVDSRINDSTFKVIARYQYDATDLSSLKDTSLNYSMAFDTGSATQHITQSIATRGIYPATATDYGGAIEYDGHQVKGVDIILPTFNWSETHYFTDAQLTALFRNNLKVRVGHVNNASFRSYDEGEVLLLGVSGAKNSKKSRWELTYKFSASPNRSDFTVGSGAAAITVKFKAGWDYMWVKYKKVLVGSEVLHRPDAVYIERVYLSCDFSQLGIGK